MLPVYSKIISPLSLVSITMVIPGDSVFMITASCSNTFTKPGNRETVKRKKKKITIQLEKIYI